MLLQLLDPASADQAGKLCDAASSAAISLCSWQEGRLGVGPTGKELVAVGDGDGRVNLVEVESDDTVGSCCLARIFNCAGSKALSIIKAFNRGIIKALNQLSVLVGVESADAAFLQSPHGSCQAGGAVAGLGRL